MVDKEDILYFRVPLDETNIWWIDGIEKMVVLDRWSSEKYISSSQNDFYRRAIKTESGSIIEVFMDSDSVMCVIPKFDDTDGRYSYFIMRNCFKKSLIVKIKHNKEIINLIQLEPMLEMKIVDAYVFVNVKYIKPTFLLSDGINKEETTK